MVFDRYLLWCSKSYLYSKPMMFFTNWRIQLSTRKKSQPDNSPSNTNSYWTCAVAVVTAHNFDHVQCMCVLSPHPLWCALCGILELVGVAPCPDLSQQDVVKLILAGLSTQKSAKVRQQSRLPTVSGSRRCSLRFDMIMTECSVILSHVLASPI